MRFLVFAEGDLGVNFAGEVEGDLDGNEERGAAEDERRDAREPLND